MSPYRKVVLSQAAGQASILLVTPILSRLVPVGELGKYQIALGIALAIQPIVTLRVDFVLPSLEHEDDATRLLRRARGTGIASAALGVVVAGVLCMFGQLHAAEVVILAGCLALAYSWVALEGGRFLRTRDLRALAVRNLISGVAAAALQCAIALVLPTAAALAGAIIAARFLAVMLSRAAAQRPPRGTSTAHNGPDPYPLRRMLNSVSMSLLDTTLLQSLVIVPGVVLGSSAAGYTGMAQRIVTSPASVIVGGLGQVAQARVAHKMQIGEHDLLVALKPVVLRLAGFAALTGLAVTFVAPLLIQPVLGAAWKPLETLLPVIAPALSMQLVSLTLAPVAVMLRIERRLVILNLIRLLVTLGGTMAVGLQSDDLVKTVAWWSGCMALGYIAQLIIVLLAARRWERHA